MSTDVAITFDVEFDINGTFAHPTKRKPVGKEAISCRVKGRDIGLGHILDILDRYGIRATFFIETLQTAWFGSAEMGDIARQLQERGHELQLHLHPVWLQFMDKQWREVTSRSPPVANTHDSLTALSVIRAKEIVQMGQQTFAEWGLPPPTAIRTGSLIIERALYPVFSQCGLTVSSSVGLGLYPPHDNEMMLYVVPREFDGVLELPVSSYMGADPLMRSKIRLATVIGMGMAEQRFFLERAQDLNCPCVVFLSHMSEFYTIGRNGRGQQNHLTTHKFHQLCQNISDSPLLNSVTMNELAAKHQHRNHQPDIPLTVPKAVSLSRFIDKARAWSSIH